MLHFDFVFSLALKATSHLHQPPNWDTPASTRLPNRETVLDKYLVATAANDEAFRLTANLQRRQQLTPCIPPRPHTIHQHNFAQHTSRCGEKRNGDSLGTFAAASSLTSLHFASALASALASSQNASGAALGRHCNIQTRPERNRMSAFSALASLFSSCCSPLRFRCPCLARQS